MTTYEKTDNPNIIKQIETVESEIHINKLEEQIATIETQLNVMSTKIEYPDKADEDTKTAIDFYNLHVFDKTEIESELQKKKSLLNNLKGL